MDSKEKSMIQYFEKLWAIGYSDTYLDNEKHWTNALEYINNNHIKHNNKALEYKFKNLTSIQDAFKPRFENGGFDIVIGNPPYGAKQSAAENEFYKQNYKCTKTITGKQKGSTDTFALFIEKAHSLVKTNGVVNMIVPISITSSDSMTALHNLLFETCSFMQVSSYSDRPQQIFSDASTKVSVIKFIKDDKPIETLLASKMYRKDKNIDLEEIIAGLEFINVNDLKLNGRIPRISYEIERNILQKVLGIAQKDVNITTLGGNNSPKIVIIGNLRQDTGVSIYYRTSGGRYFHTITNYATGSSKETAIYFAQKIANCIGAMMSSSLFYWFHQVISDLHDLKQYEVNSFGIPINELTDGVINELENLYAEYLADIERHVITHKTTGYKNISEFKEYKIVHSKHIIGKIDDLICPLYGLTTEETAYIKNYEIEFRMRGGETESGEIKNNITNNTNKLIEINYI
jgi:hypothetical protein